jgi:hypothetical protein
MVLISRRRYAPNFFQIILIWLQIKIGNLGGYAFSTREVKLPKAATDDIAKLVFKNRIEMEKFKES